VKDLLLNYFQARAFPDLAAAVRARAPHALRRWEAAVQEILPSADELTREELRDQLPDTLERLAAALESSEAGPTRQLLVESGEHGQCRFNQSYNLSELLIEFDLLRPILMEETAQQMKRDITLDEVIALNMGVDMAARRSIIAFVEYQKRELQTSSDVRAKYLSFLSHDVRGGLNAVLLTTEILHNELGPDGRFKESLEDLRTLQRNIHDTVTTMDRFLQAEQLRNGKVQPKLAEVDLRQLVHDVVAQHNGQAKSKGLELRPLIEAEHCVVSTDRELVLLILQNLVSNAVKYSTTGVIDIKVEHDDSDCRISVRDQGPGIPEDVSKRLFAPFARGETHGQPGVGLGLFIAQQAAEVLGAKLWAESEVGTGTTFHLQLPA
jgi:signal transduction histidine kinase